MAEISLKERLQPALLDRLTDEEPEKSVESRDQRIISLPKLRAGVLRDLSWLLNSVHLESTVDLDDYPNVRNSVLNYGVPSFAGSSTAEIGIGEAERRVRDAVLRFEPRLTGSSVKVSFLKESLREDSHNSLGIEIEAELWAQPVPLRMFMKTEFDLEIGAVRVTEVGDPALRSPTRRRP
jgi:type VI secretion system protein ImpF